jgi:hypothetical protein
MAGVTRVGATKKYSDNWENIFSGKRARSAAPTPAKQSAKKKAASKRGSKKAGQRTLRGK